MARPVVLASYTFLVLFQVLHTLEEIACGVFDLQVGPITVGKNRYLVAASVLSSVTIIPLVLLIYDLPLGYYLGLFTSGVIGTLQGIVHTIGFFKTRTVHRSLGVGFYSAIPLSITGIAVFVQLIRNLPK